jgi:O-antigen/teichoic acid export membrane protein
MNSIFKGAYLSYLNLFISNITGLILTPYTIKCLGASEYGLYQTMGAFVIYFGILDFGLRNSIYRYVSLYQLEKDKEKEEIFLATSLIISLFIILTLFLVSIFVFFNLDTLYQNSFTIEELKKAKKMYILLILSLMVGFPGGIFTGICNGYQDFVFTRGLSIIRYLSRAILIIIALFFDGDALSLVIIDVVMNYLAIIITYVFVVKKLKIKFNLRKFNKNIINEIFSYSIWIFIFTIISHTQWLSGQFILGITTNTKTVAIYSVGVLLGTYFSLFAYTLYDLLLPKATEVNSRELSSIELTKEIVKISRIVFYMLTFILITFYFFGLDFVLLWAGPNYYESWKIGFLIMLTIIFPLTYHYGFSIIQAKNQLKMFSLFNLIILIIFVIIGFFVSKIYSGIGFILCILSSILINTIFTLYYFKKILNFKIKYYIYHIYLKNFNIIIFTILIGFLLNQIFTKTSWCIFFIKSSIIFISYIVFLYIFKLNNTEKTIITKLLQKYRI